LHELISEISPIIQTFEDLNKPTMPTSSNYRNPKFNIPNISRAVGPYKSPAVAPNKPYGLLEHALYAYKPYQYDLLTGCGTKLTGVQVHQIMPDTRRG
jgi:hypothetical protein